MCSSRARYRKPRGTSCQRYDHYSSPFFPKRKIHAPARAATFLSCLSSPRARGGNHRLTPLSMQHAEFRWFDDLRRRRRCMAMCLRVVCVCVDREKVMAGILWDPCGRMLVPALRKYLVFRSNSALGCLFVCARASRGDPRTTQRFDAPQLHLAYTVLRIPLHITLADIVSSMWYARS